MPGKAMVTWEGFLFLFLLFEEKSNVVLPLPYMLLFTIVLLFLKLQKMFRGEMLLK